MKDAIDAGESGYGEETLVRFDPTIKELKQLVERSNQHEDSHRTGRGGFIIDVLFKRHTLHVRNDTGEKPSLYTLSEA
jgi:hypothetical protein